MKDIQERWKDRWWGRLKLQIFSTLDLGGWGRWLGSWAGGLATGERQPATKETQENGCKVLRLGGVGPRSLCLRRATQPAASSSVDLPALPGRLFLPSRAHLFSESTGTLKRGVAAATEWVPSPKDGEPFATLVPWALSSTMLAWLGVES